MWDAERLTRYWQAHYPWPPIAHTLRERCPQRWFRIHTLPDSQRYAENNAEYHTILERHNAMLDALLMPGGEAILITTGGSFTPEPVQDPQGIDDEARFWVSLPLHELDADVERPNYWHLFHKSLRWQRGTFDALLQRVADWQLVHAMILGTAQPRLYCPYDGGADVYVESPAERDALRARFSSWLSPRPSGL